MRTARRREWHLRTHTGILCLDHVPERPGSATLPQKSVRPEVLWFSSSDSGRQAGIEHRVLLEQREGHAHE
ncbi:hypothetical protein, partial [Pseudacidovorax sp. 1753]|uniref:hypothetical protein n=1 Tax=Pseudacidovorax sp. 1753 TaxID=3156419 RepID=UPI003397878C